MATPISLQCFTVLLSVTDLSWTSNLFSLRLNAAQATWTITSAKLIQTPTNIPFRNFAGVSRSMELISTVVNVAGHLQSLRPVEALGFASNLGMAPCRYVWRYCS